MVDPAYVMSDNAAVAVCVDVEDEWMDDAHEFL